MRYGPMGRRVIGINLFRSRNVGDANCSPIPHFMPGADMYDFHDIKAGMLPPLTREDVVIYGGGCVAKSAARHETKAMKILWGAGVTSAVMSPRGLDYTGVSGFALTGVRDSHGDAEIPGEWLPCPSCMSPLFDNVPAPTRRVSYLGHAKKSPMTSRGAMHNDCMDLRAVISHLAAAEIVVSSSYHGCYWGLLLGRKVIAVPFGAKFYGLPWAFPRVSDMPSIRDADALDRAGRLHAYPDALDSCRGRQYEFWTRVKGLIHG